MSKIVQEKFEVREPENRNDDPKGGWVSAESARRKDKRLFRGSQDARVVMEPGMHNDKGLDTPLNYLPPGTDIEAQRNSDIRKMGINSAGGMGNKRAEGDRTDVVTQRSLQRGFHRHPLRPTDDQYTREHNDAFYDEVHVDGVTGFVERNNYLDRA